MKEDKKIEEEMTNVLNYLNPWNEEVEVHNPEERIMHIKKLGVPAEQFRERLVKHISEYTADDIRDILIWFFSAVNETTSFKQYRFTERVIRNIEVTHGDVNSISRYFGSGGYRKWRTSTLKRIQAADTYEDLAVIYGDKGFARPLIEAYVEWAVKTPGKR